MKSSNIKLFDIRNNSMICQNDKMKNKTYFANILSILWFFFVSAIDFKSWLYLRKSIFSLIQEDIDLIYLDRLVMVQLTLEPDLHKHFHTYRKYSL